MKRKVLKVNFSKKSGTEKNLVVEAREFLNFKVNSVALKNFRFKSLTFQIPGPAGVHKRSGSAMVSF